MENEFYPGSILLILGYDCTNYCSYCYLQKNGADLEANMSLETFEKAIDWYEEYLKTPNLPYLPSIALIGGEPLCYWDKLNFNKNLPRLANIVQQYGKEVRLVSNGYLLTNEKRQLIKNYNIAMDISMDGDQISHDKNRKSRNNLPTWEKVYQSAMELKNDGNDLRVRATVARNNSNRMFEMYKFLYDSGFKRYGIEIDTFNFWSQNELENLSIEYDKVVKHYIANYDPTRSCFSLDRVLKQLNNNLIKANSMDTQFLRPNSIAILPDGIIKVNHNFPVWTDAETAKLFTIGNVFDGLDFKIVEKYLDTFGLMTESSYFAYNEENVCKTCPASNIMCQNPYCNKDLPRSVWIPDHRIQCYTLRFVSSFGIKYLKKFGYVE